MTKEQSDFCHITTIIFDMDGTLIEHTWRMKRIGYAFFAHFADRLAPVTEAEFFGCFWDKSEDMWYMMIDGIIDGDTAARYGYANTLRKLGQDPTLADSMLAYWVELVLTEAVPFKDTFTVLDTVRHKYTTGILTNGFMNLQRRKLEKYNLPAYVDFTLVSEEAGYHKPDKRAFLEALKLANNASPEETIYVGDNLEADIEGALGAGLTPIFINSENNLEAPNDVIKIQELSELLTLLEL